MVAIVLVPGGWHGGWCFERVTPRLETVGHDTVALTLRGLGASPDPTVNLDNHIDQVVAAVHELAGPVVLCGHSYGGMVITGVADRLPERIHALVYADAYVPSDGDSTWLLTSERYREAFATGAAADGLTVAPRPGLDSRCRPHPIACFLQAIRLTGAWRGVRHKHYLAALGWSDSPFRSVYSKLRSQPDWRVEALDCAHNIPKLAPDNLVSTLLAAALD